MPVIVPPDAFDFWLDCANVDAVTAAALFVPAPEDVMEAYEISTAVNRVANDDPQVLEPVTAADGAGACTGAGQTGRAGKEEGRAPAVAVRLEVYS